MGERFDEQVRFDCGAERLEQHIGGHLAFGGDGGADAAGVGIVAVFGLGVVLCVVLIGLFGHGCSLPFMRWAVTRRGLWLWPSRTWQDAS